MDIEKVGPKGYEHGWHYVGGSGLPKPHGGRKPAGSGHAEKPKQSGSELHDVKGRKYTLTAQDKKDVKAAKLSTNQQMAYTAHRFDGRSHEEALRRARQSAKTEGDNGMGEAFGFVPIEKFEKTGDGTLIVRGPATDSSMDRDRQIADPGWLSKSMPNWFTQGGNVREQHDGKRAAGVALTYEKRDGDVHWIEAEVVDPVTVKKVEKGVLRGFSFGARNARVVKDDQAPGGRIVDGEIYEVSLVDRPANPNCLFTVAKAEGSGDLELVESPELVETEDATKADAEPTFTPSQFADLLKGLGKVAGAVEKRDVGDKERENLADAGKALPNGSFPIKNVGDLKNAIRAVGRAKDPAKAKALIKRRAKALGREDLLPDGWKSSAKADGEPDDMVHDPADIAAVRDGLIALIKAELDELTDGEDELCDVTELLCALKMLMCWWDHEASEGETADPFPNGDDDASQHDDHPMPIIMAADGEKAADTVEKTDDTNDTTDGQPAAEQTLTKTDVAALIEDAITKAVKPYEDALNAVKGELAEVKATPLPGGPARTRTSGQTAIAAKADGLRANETHLQKMVDTTAGDLQAGYRTRLKEVQSELRDLAKVNGG